jgi:putative oxidoreductase
MGMWTLNFLIKLQPVGLLVLRLLVGFAFFWVHGLEKMRAGGAWDWGQAWVAKMAGVAPDALLYVACWTEFLAGAALALGLLTRWASLGLLGVMLYAIFKVHGGDPYNVREMAIAYGAAAFLFLTVGPGAISLDRVLFGRDAVEER